MFIADRRNAFLERIYIAYGRRLVKRSFARVHVTHAECSDGTSGTSWAESDAPVIAFINHSAWWDAVVPFVLSRDLFRRESYAIMEGEQLARYRFFRRLGCFGATSSSLSDARATVDHAVKVLRGGPRRTLWVAPQGALLAERAPLVFRSGLARIARAVPEATLLPVALRFEFRKQQLPTCFVRIGGPLAAVGRDEPVRVATARLCSALAHELAVLDAALLTSP
ncbi:MAG: lysophospholipid acyltransferase family protein [Gemmatimonadaceae bacterium]